MEVKAVMMQTIALVADDRKTLNHLVFILAPLSLTIAGTYTSLKKGQWQHESVQLWLVISQDAANILDSLNKVTDVPVLLADVIPPRQPITVYRKWCSNLKQKITMNLKLCTVLPAQRFRPFRDIWIIAASVGGPEAVRVFFSHVLPNLPVAFIYAQHIEATIARNLLNIITSASPMSASLAHTGQRLSASTVTVLPSNTLTGIDYRGQIQVADNVPWQPPYTPNLNQFIDNVAHYFLTRMGVIILSGMCDDGTRAAIKIARQGVPVWAQSPEDCICSSMPDAVIGSGLVSFIGNARALANNMNKTYR